ncbi:MAG: hypothetical protein EPO51_08325 [Phenylobacterium sp.]|uniref:hypothetical protein n=1 Tax=Phenylobacterium sp. TaxID=1871053 RepID=UPI00120968BD|nr:hypothetical protein [Phenylobacterium sp.]TAJ72115.1 MAG: hypothetical protein EPO51_08325 [Phenylobacterium sp.]
MKDLAALFVRYRVEDWGPLIQELETRRGSRELADAIRSLAIVAEESRPARAPSKRAPKKAKPKMASSTTDPKFTADRAPILASLLEALRTKQALPKSNDLKAAYSAAGLKLPMPARRDDAVVAIVRQLNDMAPARFEDALRAIGDIKAALPGDSPDDYGRWIDIILKPSS